MVENTAIVLKFSDN